MIPVAHNAKAFKFFALNVKPFLSKLAAFLTEFGDWNIVLVFAFSAIAFFDFPFNRKTVAIPTRHIDGILTEHLLRTGDDVFEDFVERVPNVQMAVGIRGAVMKDKHFTIGRNTANFAIEILILPLVKQCGLHLWQTRPHREIGFGQDNGLFVFDTHRDGPVVLKKLKGRTPGDSGLILAGPFKGARIIAGSSINSNLAENLFGRNDICGDLGLYGIKPVELPFAPDKAVQTHANLSVINVLIEIKQVRF